MSAEQSANTTNARAAVASRGIAASVNGVKKHQIRTMLAKAATAPGPTPINAAPSTAG